MPAAQPDPTADVAERVLRRAEIAKVARNLQDCLTLANFKAQNGWQDRSLRTIEPEISEHIRRKRPYSSGDILSDSASESSEENQFSPSVKAASFSSNIRSSRSRSKNNQVPKLAPSLPRNSHKRARANSTANIPSFAKPTSSSQTSWKARHSLPQSSPVYNSRQNSSSYHSNFASDSADIPAPDASPLFDHRSPSPNSAPSSPCPPFASTTQAPSSSILSSSPPRTPPPTRPSKPSRNAGADLLLYLKNSPSPAPRTKVDPPSTPPSASAALFNTPGQPGFNFADFCNVTPSPAQGAWRTPGKTPLMPKSARRGLTFDSREMGPPMSPAAGEERRKGRGLALDMLGEPLLP
ncbi:MAG: hypothetical protein Q9227_005072 [Pyrenula ochraceoflavens]